jgi:LPXTG-site transpeptidase (sortase) family protein
MNPNDQQYDTGQDLSLPLPPSASKPQDAQVVNPAAELIRHKVEAAYANEPDATEDALDVAEMGPNAKRTRHQQFIYDLTNSGKSLAEIQQGWHQYYAGLTDVEKHEVWQEFYSAQSQASKYAAVQSSMAPEPELKQLDYEDIPLLPPKPQFETPQPLKAVTRTIGELRDLAVGNVSSKKQIKPMQHVQSLLFGLGVGSVVMLIFLFSFFNERFIAPFIQPSRNISNTEIIATSTNGGSEPEIIIPKINVEIPVIYDVNTIEESAVEKGLERGVVHYANTSNPGQDGNVVVFGHSSNNIFNPGKYKFAFVLLSHLENGDTFYLQKDGKRYTYQVFKKEIVKPSDVGVLAASEKQATATLITCDPPGTSTNRLVVVGEQISPDPTQNSTPSTQTASATQPAIIPGNGPTLWGRFWHWFSS